MSEENTVAELAQAAFDAFWASPALGKEPPAPLGRESAGIRNAWAAVAVAVASRVASPTAEDYDHAAEIMKLRRRLDDAAAVLDDIAAENGNGYYGQRARGALRTLKADL